jgi:fermentation-respiration switch protein FrsA (DUF1100 family)
MRRIIVTVAASLFLTVFIVVAAGEALSWPASRPVGAPPPDLHASTVRLPVSSTAFVSGWFMRGRQGSGAILLLHGVRADRTQMLDRARFLGAAGYSVLLIDLPSHGESSGDRITFGVHEGAGVTAAFAFLRHELPAERLGAIGVSLGAASLVLSHPTPALNAVVLESMYPTITEAVQDRLAARLGQIGPAFAPLLLCQLPLRLGITEAQLRPIDTIGALGAPVLIASGTDDQHTTWTETQRIFAAANEPKELWPVAGAAHVDLHAYNSVAYEARILKFLSKHLRHEVINATPT